MQKLRQQSLFGMLTPGTPCQSKCRLLLRVLCASGELSCPGTHRVCSRGMQRVGPLPVEGHGVASNKPLLGRMPKQGEAPQEPAAGLHVSCLPQLLATLLATSHLACIKPTPHPQPCLQQAHHGAMRLWLFPPLTGMEISTPEFNCGAFHCLPAGMKHALAHPQPFACSKQPNTFPASKP